MADLYNLLDGLVEEQPSSSDDINTNNNENIPLEQQQQEWEEPEEVAVQPIKNINNNNGEDDLLEKPPLALEDYLQATDVDENERPCTKLTQWFKQEQKCPDLLPYDSNTLQALVEQLEHNTTTSTTTTGGVNANLQAILASIHNVDQERIQYLVANLLRLRLEKIERHALYLRKHTDLMSPAEIEFLQDYGRLMEGHLETTVPITESDYRGLEDEGGPHNNAYVFCRILAPFLQMSSRDFEAGTCLIAPYATHVSEHTRAGTAELL